MMNSSPRNSYDKTILNQIRSTVYRTLDPQKYKIFLFGSRANWKARKTSDYDIGIMWDDRVNFNALMRIRSDLEDIPALIDIVDFQTTDALFKKMALQSTISIEKS